MMRSFNAKVVDHPSPPVAPPADVILCIDPSSTCCGAAIFNRGKLHRAWPIKPDKQTAPAPIKITSMIRRFRIAIQDYGVTTVVIEEPSKMPFKGRMSAFVYVQRSYARIYQAMLDTVADTHSVPVMTWTRRVKKEDRAKAITHLMAGTTAAIDKGLDAHDAAGLGFWWVQFGRSWLDREVKPVKRKKKKPAGVKVIPQTTSTARRNPGLI